MSSAARRDYSCGCVLSPGDDDSSQSIGGVLADRSGSDGVRLNTSILAHQLGLESIRGHSILVNQLWLESIRGHSVLAQPELLSVRGHSVLAHKSGLESIRCHSVYL